MEERSRFVLLTEKHQQSFSSLCTEYGISRKTDMMLPENPVSDLNQEIDSFRRIVYRKRFSKNLSGAVTAQCHVSFLRVVDWNSQNLIRMPGIIKQIDQCLILPGENASLTHLLGPRMYTADALCRPPYLTLQRRTGQTSFRRQKMKLDEKRTLVSGGAVRIGRAIAEALAAEGAEVIIHFRSSEPNWPKSIQADLSDPAQCEMLISRAAEQFGPIDILINNAAVFHHTSILNSSHETLMTELQPNLLAPFALIRGFAQQTKTGKIINLLDRRVTTHDTSCVPYMISKKGLEDLTKLAALELAPGITVNAIAPGAVLPPPDKEGDTDWEPAGTIPLDRRPTPEDIAEATVFLLKADSITGQTLFVDGGQHLTT